MFKNLTIRQLSIYITILVVIINVVILGVLYLGGIDSVFTVLLVIILGGGVAYLVINYLLEEYIFRRIKLIYKIIHQSKLNKNARKVDINTTSLEKVNAEVVEWAERTEKEIQSLKLLEGYRKEFVGNISHELKTPIFSIQGYLHTLLDGGIHDSNINVKYIKRAAKNAERLQDIVEDLEAISKLESGNLVLEIKKFDIRGLVQEVFIDLERYAEEKDISLSFKDGANYAYNVMADREYIRRVLNNLITNSIKYGKKGGKTKVSFYNIDENILVEVSDNGFGIDENHLKHLFDRFYRVDSNRSRSEGGAGLGLSIVKHIIEAHNQTINVRSTSGIGSTFGFTLKKAQ